MGEEGTQGVGVHRLIATWAVTASGTGGTVSATRAAKASRRHYVTTMSGTASTGTTIPRVELVVNGVVVYQGHASVGRTALVDSATFYLSLPIPFRVMPGKSVTLRITGHTGTGFVSMMGYTE